MYFNSEVRVPVGLLGNGGRALKISMIGFYDMGKIIQEGQTEEDWQLVPWVFAFSFRFRAPYTLSVVEQPEETAIMWFMLGTDLRLRLRFEVEVLGLRLG